MSRIKYRSPEVQEQRRSFAKRMTLIFGILTILIIVGVVFLLRMDSIQIKETNIEGVSIIDKKEVEDTVRGTLSGNYLWLIPKSNTFLYSVNKLNNLLVQKFPGIYSLDVGREGFGKVYVKIVERKPETLWCQDNGDEALPWCFFVDSTGVVFAEAPYFSGNVYFIYKGKLNQENPMGAQIFTKQDFSIFVSFIKQAGSKLGLDIVGVELKDVGDFDLLLSSGTKILLNKNISYDDMYNNLDAVFKSQQLSSSTLSTLDYIDMRFGNKVYYKAKTLPKL
jgi:cell division septal protein FtsQ